MRILIVGNDPDEIGGVANYTRPLAQAFSDAGEEVFYFYSGAWNRRYDWRLKPYVTVRKGDHPFECAELINSPCWPTNFGNPEMDVSEPKTEALFDAYLDRIRPDVIHIHSRMGLPASIAERAAARGIPVLNTVHVYGYLCQKRVMIDYLGNPCEGPTNITKCARCTGKLNVKKLKLNARIGGSCKSLLNLLVSAKRLLNGGPGDRDDGRVPDVQGKDDSDPALAEGLAKRLAYMIGLLNTSVDKTICVSEDVRKTLVRFGVREERLLVQHIGSRIAERQYQRKKPLHDPVVIGNIGGVSYYKGSHILIDAVARMKSRDFQVKIFGKYDEHYRDTLMKGRENLPVEFAGRYDPEELPGILEQIDIVVLPSVCNDTAPQTIFESYSCSVPIVASNIGGFPDFIQDGINGRLVQPNDADHLAEVLDDIVGNRERIHSFSGRIPKLKTIRQNAEELLSLYGSLRSASCSM